MFMYRSKLATDKLRV